MKKKVNQRSPLVAFKGKQSFVIKDLKNAVIELENGNLKIYADAVVFGTEKQQDKIRKHHKESIPGMILSQGE